MALLLACLTLAVSAGADDKYWVGSTVGTVGRGADNQSAGANLVSGEVRLGYDSGSLTAGTLTLGFWGDRRLHPEERGA